ncbi:MAG: glycosyltransferase family 9 protein [Candidatus Melainabacteria bacterium]|nr:glycosyltransferase family 9 protein [Candidatus Melainabacteria bacterium]
MSPLTASTDELASARRILVMRYRFIGDTILTVPFLRNLRRAYPQAQIDVLVGPQSGSVLQGCPYIDELIVFDTTRFHKYDCSAGQARSFLSYAFELRSRHYDLVFVLKRSWSSGLLAWLTGAPLRVGYNTQGRAIFLTHPVVWSPHTHEVVSMLDVLRQVNIAVNDDYLECWVTRQEEEEIRCLVPQLTLPGPHILLHAAAAHPAKMYPLEHWARIANQLRCDFNAILYFTGASQDSPLYDRLIQLSGGAGINLAGKLSIRQSLALYKRLHLAVCVDSGPVHMACSVGTPTLALFGPSDPSRWRPWGIEHQAIFDPTLRSCPCQINHTCTNRPCLTKLSAELVYEACCAKLNSRAAQGS